MTNVIKVATGRGWMIGLSFIICQLSISPAGAQSRYIQAVDEYRPAPGQFVNVIPKYEEGDTPETMAQKCTERIAGGNGQMITLGAYGGYVVFHFDHPIVNIAGQRDFAIWGNAFENNAEPAIVMVAVDANGNGLPDDEWYELKGSEYDNPVTIHDYEITYQFSAMQDIAWTDNQGQTGTIRRNAYHDQEYFPLWLTDNGQLTFKGARLPNNAHQEGSTYLLPAYDFGYADNKPNSDTDGCSMDIGWAVDSQGHPVVLTHIDFVKCYNAMNQQCGWIGETSTEIIGAEDLHPDATLGTKEIIQFDNLQFDKCYDLQGRKLSNGIREALGSTKKLSNGQMKKGLYIRNGKKYIIK